MLNKNTETLVKENSLKIIAELEASKTIAVATALGANIPAPTGTHIYLALTYNDENRTRLLGACQSEYDAQKRTI